MNEYHEGPMSTEVVVCRQKSVDGNCGLKNSKLNVVKLPFDIAEV